MVDQRDCAEIDDALPAYAANALDEADRAFVESHLLGCDRHEEAGDWGDVALRLADLAAAAAPPERLRARILAIPTGVDTPAAPQPAPVEVAPPRVQPRPARRVEVPPAHVEGVEQVRPPEARFASGTASGVPVPGANPASTAAPATTAPSPRPLPAARRPYQLVAAGFAALVIFFFGAWVGVFLTGGDGDDSEPALTGTTSADGIEASATYVEEHGVALVRFSGLAPLPDGSAYQLWATAPGADPAPRGAVPVQGGDALVAVEGDFAPGWSFAVTIEPEGPAQAPTSNPVVEVTLAR